MKGQKMNHAADLAAPLATPAAILAFAAGGKAIFTVVTPKSGARFTYRVRAADGLAFVDVLTGSDNLKDYTFIGTARGKGFKHSPKSPIGQDAASVKVFAALDAALGNGEVFGQVYHAGRCCVCGRMLTTPESVQAGIGPDCAARMAGG